MDCHGRFSVANKRNSFGNLAILATVIILSSFIPTAKSSLKEAIFPEVEVTLSNDGTYPVWFMCQMTDKDKSLYELQPNSTYRYSFPQVAFPMRWCYLYINQNSNGFFWAYTMRARCTKCFWSINKHPSLYRGDQGRWERQKLYMPPGFNILSCIHAPRDPTNMKLSLELEKKL